MSQVEALFPTDVALVHQHTRAQEAKDKVDKLRAILHRHDIEAPKDVLDGFMSKHAWRKPRWLDKLQTVTNNVQIFSQAIGSICQAHGIASVVWGVLRFILDAFGKYFGLLDRVVDIYDEMTRAMPVLKDYARLYAAWPTVSDSLLDIYCSYLDFSLNAVEIFNRNPLNRIGFVRDVIGVDIWERVGTKEVTSIQGPASQERLKLSRIFSVPKARNGKFCGRKEVLAQLDRDLLPAQSSPQKSCTLHGAPGMGKTQIALEFAYRCCETFPELHIFWVPAEDEAALSQAFGKIARLVRAGKDVSDQARLVENATAWLCKNTSWLMIFDNVNNPDIFKKYQPCCNHGSILVTSQYQRTIHATTKEIPLRHLTPQEGSDFLLDHISEQQKLHMGDPDSLAQVFTNMSEEVNGSPLVLVGIAGSIISSAVSAEGALKVLQQSGSLGKRNPITNGHSAWAYDRPIDSAWDMALRAVPDKGLTILRIMSMLAADNIPVDILNRDLQGKLSFLGYQDSARFRHEIQAALVERYLVEDSNPALSWSFYSIHRQLQSKILRDLQAVPHQHQLTFDRAVALIARDFPAFPKFMTPNFSQWPSDEKLIAHVLKLHSVYRANERSQYQDETPTEVPLVPSMAFAELLTGAGYYLYEVGLADSCVAVLETAEKISHEFRTSSTAEATIQGGQPSLYADSLKLETTAIAISWGIIEQAQGLTGARKAMAKAKEVVALRENHASLPGLSPSDRYESQVLLSNAYNDIGIEKIHMHQYASAMDYLQNSLDLKRQLEAQGLKIPAFEFAESINNMGFAALGQNLTEEALKYSEKAVYLINKDGSHDSDVTRFTFSHGVTLFLNGQPQKALDVMKQVYQNRKDVFGESGRQTRDASYAVSFIYYAQGHFEDASKTIQGCFIKQAKSIWPAECLTRAKYLESRILQALGDMTDGKKKHDEALDELDGYLSQIFPKAHAQKAEKDTVACSSYAYLMAANEALRFDYVVPFYAGRFATGESAGRGNARGCYPPLEDLE
ncbi:hypothetical protein GE21DRAFT_6889 [Neurospora crassa]|uniref:Uncharacterized protein n=2 Tax=Neurospora crassa TaxID=5141 RepID=Q1K649_NEUCR|nr:hypothetical protein NCU07767 [Neurospora crassa OR74A]EAA29025.1 hypothetical protein NCU07767 [Neurospora crassa OR74A]KHE85040.1 hypothetical protein GE21DRAFT_6889 [Neurospora crassa]CAD11784.1 conserved hypothetical protein [Neurospora crassa]|eukprot:XP_958261.1 hypothetical protein NCU07767 [Neurospora crassa OR74A]